MSATTSTHPAASALGGWLSHLRTDRRGLPVPWVNQWGPERADRVSIAFDPVVAQHAVFVDDSGEDEPDFTAANMTRQRHAVFLGRCQVCGRGVPWSRRVLVVADISVERVELPAVGPVMVITEPWLDERCASIALRYCPALIRRTRAEQLTTLSITSRRQVGLVASQGWVDGPLEQRSRDVNPAMWGKVFIESAGWDVAVDRGARLGVVAS